MVGFSKVFNQPCRIMPTPKKLQGAANCAPCGRAGRRQGGGRCRADGEHGAGRRLAEPADEAYAGAFSRWLVLNLLPAHQAGESLEGSVICFFHIRRKTAGGQLPAVQMVAQALTAIAFSGARFVGAVAIGHIPVLVAIHGAFLYRYGLFPFAAACFKYLHQLSEALGSDNFAHLDIKSKAFFSQGRAGLFEDVVLGFHGRFVQVLFFH